MMSPRFSVSSDRAASAPGRPRPGHAGLQVGQLAAQVRVLGEVTPVAGIFSASSAISLPLFRRACRASPTTPRSAWNWANDDSSRAAASGRPTRPVRLTAML